MTATETSKIKIIYICHEFADDPAFNSSKILHLCRRLVKEALLPLAPQLYLPQFLREDADRQRAMSYCLRLVALVDDVWVFGEPTEGMKLEIIEAKRLGIPVINCTEEGKPR